MSREIDTLEEKHIILKGFAGSTHQHITISSRVDIHGSQRLGDEQLCLKKCWQTKNVLNKMGSLLLKVDTHQVIGSVFVFAFSSLQMTFSFAAALGTNVF